MKKILKPQSSLNIEIDDANLFIIAERAFRNRQAEKETEERDMLLPETEKTTALFKQLFECDPDDVKGFYAYVKNPYHRQVQIIRTYWIFKRTFWNDRECFVIVESDKGAVAVMSNSIKSLADLGEEMNKILYSGKYG